MTETRSLFPFVLAPASIRWSSSRSRRLLVETVLVVSFLVVAAGRARAEGVDAAEKLIREGVELRKAGHDDQALVAFQSAYRIRPSARAQAQMGLAEQALGRWVDAERDVKGALQAETDPWITRNGVTLRGALAAVKDHLGSLQLQGSPPGARIVIDERDVGKMPLEGPVRVPAGQVLVTVSAPGFIEISRKVTVAVGSLSREVIALHASAPDRPVTAAGPLGSPPTVAAADVSQQVGDGEGGARRTGGKAAAPEDRSEDESPAAPHGLGPLQSWSIAVAAGGVVAAGVGTVFAFQAASKNKDSRSGCAGDVCNPAGAQIRRDALTAGNRATAGFLVGGVLVAGGVVMFLLGRPAGAASESAIHVVPLLGPGSLAVLGTARF